MRTYTYTGYFNGFTLQVECLGFFQAYILLTARAIKGAKDYRSLHRIVNEDSGYEERVHEDIIPFKNK